MSPLRTKKTLDGVIYILLLRALRKKNGSKLDIVSCLHIKKIKSDDKNSIKKANHFWFAFNISQT